MTTDKIKCLLVDDEQPALEVLKSYIQSVPFIEVSGEFSNALAALEFLRHHSIDLIFLDINMPKLTGIELIKTLPSHPRIIFTTAHRDYALDGFDLGAIDYLLKPITLDRFLKAVYKLTSFKTINEEEKLEVSSDRFLYFRSDRKMIKVMLNDILYVESLKDYIRINTLKGSVITKQSTSSIEAMLPDEFVRIHRSFIVSVSKIDSYTNTDVFIGKTELPIGPLYKHEIGKLLQQSFT